MDFFLHNHNVITANNINSNFSVSWKFYEQIWKFYKHIQLNYQKYLSPNFSDFLNSAMISE